MANILKITSFNNPSLRNSCYVNSAATALLNMPGLIESLPYNHPVEKVGVILEDLRNLEEKTNTESLRESVSRYAFPHQPDRFVDSAQHDCSEFLESVTSTLCEQVPAVKDHFLLSFLARRRTCSNPDCGQVKIFFFSNNISIIILNSEWKRDSTVLKFCHTCRMLGLGILVAY